MVHHIGFHDSNAELFHWDRRLLIADLQNDDILPYPNDLYGHDELEQSIM